MHGFTFGDSLDDTKRSKWQEFTVRLNKILGLEEPWILIIDGALANSIVAPATMVQRLGRVVTGTDPSNTISR